LNFLTTQLGQKRGEWKLLRWLQ